MRNTVCMLEELAKLDWDVNQRSVTTRGGMYIASASSERFARQIVKLSIIARLLLEIHKNDPKVIEQLKEKIKDE